MDTAIAAFTSFFGGRPQPEITNRYQPLQAADSIRLVSLSVTDGEVHGTLKEVRLSQRPAYHALSYSWGEAFNGANGEAGPGATRPFVLDGHAIQVTANLADFLDAVAKLTESQMDVPKIFWIDALCINQADNEEKSVQVGMMRQIYDQAAGILIWLGKHDEASRFNLIKMGWCLGTMRRFEQSLGDRTVFQGLRAEDGAVKDRSGWESLGRFFARRKWWQRMWTVQEYIPDVKKLFMCGDLVFEHEYLHRTLQLSFLLSQTEPGFEFLENAGFSVAERIEIFRKMFHDKSRPPLGVYDVLSRCRRRSATDPRTKCQRSDPALKIDYSLSAEAVFTNVAEHLLRTTHGLDWLEAVIPSRASKCASWVPDWGPGRALVFQPLPKMANNGNPVYRPWGTSDVPVENPEAARVVRQGNRAELHVTGIILDEITCLYDRNNTPGDVVVVQSWIECACRELAATYPHTGETILQAVLRTITVDCVQSDGDTFARGQDKFDELASLGVGEIVRKLFRFDAATDIESKLRGGLRLQMTAWRRFAVTRHGFIGLVPCHSRVGDKVCSFSGGRVLYVTREITRLWWKEYYYVGESYFHGLMDGEWRESDSDLFGQPSPVVLI